MFRLLVVLALGVSPAAAEAPPVKGARTLYLVRHGAYDENDKRDEKVGRGLVPIGIAQARLLGARLRGLPFRFDAALASPMTRARETAAVLSDDLGLKVETVADLAECTPPTRRLDVMKEEKPEDLAACTTQLERLATRLLQPTEGADRNELVVAHGNVIRWLTTRALDVDRAAWLVMSVGHASLTVLRVQADGAPRVISVGDVGHLPPGLQTGGIGMPARSLAVP